jgi:hypothetical protein
LRIRCCLWWCWCRCQHCCWPLIAGVCECNLPGEVAEPLGPPPYPAPLVWQCLSDQGLLRDWSCAPAGLLLLNVRTAGASTMALQPRANFCGYVQACITKECTNTVH